MTDSTFILPTEVIESMSKYKQTYNYEIKVDEKSKNSVEMKLKELIDEQPILKLTSFDEELKMWTSSIELTANFCYAFMGILGGIGILNLINTIINSIYTRKRELGMLATIGLSDRQLIRMLQIEGLFYTTGTLLLSLIIGNIVGYYVYMWAKLEGIFSIRTYYYPTLPTIVLVVFVLGFQLVLTFLVSRNFKKETLIDRVRFSQ